MRPMITNRVLVVCTANMIRSPFVAALLRTRLASCPGAVLDISSAGTAARPGDAAADGVIEMGRTYGLSLDEHRTRRLDEGVLQTGDTVLCAERAHRRAVLDLRPDLISSVFTVREFARSVETVTTAGGAGNWPALVQAAARARSVERRGLDDDIVDPVGRPADVWLAFEREATWAVSTILASIASLPRIDAEAAAQGFIPATRREYRGMQLAEPPAAPPAGWRS